LLKNFSMSSVDQNSLLAEENLFQFFMYQNLYKGWAGCSLVVLF
jgi:hypothetical protein